MKNFFILSAAYVRCVLSVHSQSEVASSRSDVHIKRVMHHVHTEIEIRAKRDTQQQK